MTDYFDELAKLRAYDKLHAKLRSMKDEAEAKSKRERAITLLKEAGFEINIAGCDHLDIEIKYLGEVLVDTPYDDFSTDELDPPPKIVLGESLLPLEPGVYDVRVTSVEDDGNIVLALNPQKEPKDGKG